MIQCVPVDPRGRFCIRRAISSGFEWVTCRKRKLLWKLLRFVYRRAISRRFSTVFILGGKVVEHVVISIDFQNDLKFCVYYYVDCLRQRFRKSQIHSHAAAFYKAEVIILSQIGRQVEAKQRIAEFVIFSGNVDVLVFESFSGSLKQTHVSSRYFSGREIQLQRLHGLFLSVQLQSQLRESIMFEVEWIFGIRAVESVVIDYSQNQA